MIQETTSFLTEASEEKAAISRRSFFTWAGIGIVSATVLASCSKDKSPGVSNGVIDLGGGDIGILNYAYALEQLEAAFYTQVMATPYNSISVSESQMLNDIRMHEVAHREFFKNALGSKAIPGLTPDFSSVDFTSRDSVLATAKAFEDLGVSAYNGAGQLIADGNYLTLAGKIVSVEARHAAYIRDLISNGSFADSSVIGNDGLEKSKSPSEVLGIAGTFIKDKISASNLPTS